MRGATFLCWNYDSQDIKYTTIRIVNKSLLPNLQITTFFILLLRTTLKSLFDRRGGVGCIYRKAFIYALFFGCF